MKKYIEVKNKKYEINGEWNIDLASKTFHGKLLDDSGTEKMVLDFKIPISAIIKFGLEYFEECIESDLKTEIEKKL